MALLGHGSTDKRLGTEDIRGICAEALSDLPLDGKRVLVLIPDHTRHAPIDLFFHVLSDLLQPRVEALDYLVATGTHAAMEMERIYKHTGLTPSEHRQRYPKVRFFNHQHHRRDELVSLGTLKGDEVAQLTQGLFHEDIPVTINRMATQYDHILIVSPVVPHEAMVEKFHWLAAVITNPVVNGVKDTPTRKVINRAVQFLSTPRTCFAFAVDDQHQLACLFAGTPEEAWSRAADFSAMLHITYVKRPYRRVLGLTPAIYEDLWVAGKAMYKLEPVVADGGELVIYGPHVKAVSFMHGREIERIGYHVRDYFTKQWDRFAREPKLILAHSTNVRGIGRFEGGREEPRVTVTLATSIAKQTCDAINLSYRAPDSIDIEAWRADPDTLVVEEAGQVLYRLAQPAG